MSVTIHVNGRSNSLVHKGSMGIAKSTLPDVCKTPSPSGPVPMPYPVIVSLSSDLKKGTKSVKVDGNNPAAVKGSEFSRCSGDEPGTAGGVKSSTNMKEATWLLYSFDVKIDGKNACRLSDKMMMNHGNTACLGGVGQWKVTGDLLPYLVLYPIELNYLCCLMCEEKDTDGHKQVRVAKKIDKKLPTACGEPPATLNAEVPYLKEDDGTIKIVSRRTKGHRRPDVVTTDGASPDPENVRLVVEMKFKNDPPYSRRALDQIKAYEDMFGDDNVVTMIEGVNCKCGDDEKEKERVREPVLEKSFQFKEITALALISYIAADIAIGSMVGGPVGAVAGAAVAAIALIWTSAFSDNSKTKDKNAT